MSNSRFTLSSVHIILPITHSTLLYYLYNDSTFNTIELGCICLKIVDSKRQNINYFDQVSISKTNNFRNLNKNEHMKTNDNRKNTRKRSFKKSK